MDKKIFFAGNLFGDGGPMVVNRNLVKPLKKDISFVTCKNPYFRILETIYKILSASIVIFSGVTRYDQIAIPICKLFKKKIIYIMHGCLKIENPLNGNYMNKRGIINEQSLMKNADLILCVSTTFRNFIFKYYPQYSNKIDVLTNGIDWEALQITDISNNKKDPNKIILMGGGRRTKRNLIICKAIQDINEHYGTHYHVAVYGSFSVNDDSKEISQIPCVTYHECIPRTQILKELQQSQLYIQNSDFEPFSLGVIEALCCGCDILISQYVGAKDIITNLSDDDIIFDTTNIDHIKRRILQVMKKSNNNTLLNSIDKQKTSIENRANQLINFANQL